MEQPPSSIPPDPDQPEHSRSIEDGQDETTHDHADEQHRHRFRRMGRFFTGKDGEHAMTPKERLVTSDNLTLERIAVESFLGSVPKATLWVDVVTGKADPDVLDTSPEIRDFLRTERSQTYISYWHENFAPCYEELLEITERIKSGERFSNEDVDGLFTLTTATERWVEQIQSFLRRAISSN